MSLNVVDFPKQNLADVPTTLRTLADNIEKGEFGECLSLAWVMDQGDGVVAVGLIGHSQSPGPHAYYLLGLGQRSLEV